MRISRGRRDTLRAFSSRLRTQGPGVPQMLVAHGLACGKPMEIVLAGPRTTDADAWPIRTRFPAHMLCMMRAEHAAAGHAGAGRRRLPTCVRTTRAICLSPVLEDLEKLLPVRPISLQ